MTYRELLYDLCNNVDFNDPEETTRLVQMFAGDLLRYHFVVMKQEEKLKKLMSAKDYENWAKKIAKELFKQDTLNMPDSDFKKFVLENMDSITDLDEGK